MSVLDIFKSSNAFDSAELTNAINLVPNKYGRLAEMGLFRPRGIRTTVAYLEFADGVLNILPTRPRGAPSTLGTTGKRRVHSVNIPHIPHDDVILADDVQNVRAFGSDNRLMAISDLVNDKLITMRSKHDQTLEVLRWHAFSGVVVDAEGTELVDLHTLFGTTEEEVDFEFSSDTFDARLKCLEVKRFISKNLKGLTSTGVHCFCSEEWFDGFIGHVSVKTAYERWRDGEALRNDPRAGFEFAGITFEEHNGEASDIDGNVTRFVPADTCRFIPVGAPGLFEEYYAPADFLEAVNTPGRPLYAKQEVMKFERGVEIHTQSNPLPICTRPELCVKGTLS